MSSPFIWQSGGSDNGLLTASGVVLMTTELQGVANGAVAVSSVNGASGVFFNSNTAQAILADVVWSVGSPGTTSAQPGGNLTGWFLKETQVSGGGFIIENGTVAPPRSPDFVIPISAGGANVGGVYPSNGTHAVIVPATPFKVLIQNNTSATLGSGSTAPSLILAPVAVQY